MKLGPTHPPVSVVVTLVPLSVTLELMIEFAPFAFGMTLLVKDVEVVFPVEGVVHEGIPADVSCSQFVPDAFPATLLHAEPVQ